MKNKKRKLTLNTEVVARLNGEELDAAVGGCNAINGGGGNAGRAVLSAGTRASCGTCGNTCGSCQTCGITCGDCDIPTFSDGGWCLPICV